METQRNHWNSVQQTSAVPRITCPNGLQEQYHGRGTVLQSAPRNSSVLCFQIVCTHCYSSGQTFYMFPCLRGLDQ